MTNLSSLTIILVIIGYCNAIYIMGRQGQSCWDACFEQQLNCGKKKKKQQIERFWFGIDGILFNWLSKFFFNKLVLISNDFHFITKFVNRKCSKKLIFFERRLNKQKITLIFKLNYIIYAMVFEKRYFYYFNQLF